MPENEKPPAMRVDIYWGKTVTGLHNTAYYKLAEQNSAGRLIRPQMRRIFLTFADRKVRVYGKI